MPQAIWIFDMDGTYITSSTDYFKAVLRCLLMLVDFYEHQIPHYKEVVPKFISLLEEIDKKRVPVLHAHRGRYAGSMVLAYRQLCQGLRLEVDPVFEQKILELCTSILCSEETYRNRGMIPGAENTLVFLQDKGALLFCVTAGDPEVQWTKWRGYNLGRFFPTDRVFIVVEWEKFETLKRLRSEFPDSPMFMVGDTIRSDILPASAAGIKPIFIPHPSVWDNGELVKDLPKGAIKFSRITDIIDRFDELVRLASS